MKKLLVFFLIIFGFFLIYQPHLNDPGEVNIYGERVNTTKFPGYYPHPLHTDEWTSIAITQDLMEKNKFPDTNPYKDVPRHNPQSGVHILQGIMFFITDLNITYFFQFLPAMFAVINSLIIFTLIRNITKNDYAGFFSSIFFLSIQSNSNILGHFFFVPSTFSIYLLVSFLYFYHKKQTSLYLLTFIISLIAYPMLSTLLLAIYLINELLNKKYNYLLILLPSLLALTSLIIFNFNISRIIEEVIFKPDQIPIANYIYGIFELVNPLIFLFAVLGIIFLVKHKSFFLIAALLPIINILTHIFLNITYFMPYQRALLYFHIILTIIAGIGVFYTYQLVKFKNKYLIITLAILLLIIPFIGYYDTNEYILNRYHLITEDEINALEYFSQEYGEYNIVHTHPSITYAIYPLTKNKVHAVPPSTLFYGNQSSFRLLNQENCRELKEYSLKHKIDYIITYNQLECNLQYETIENLRIYKVKPDD